MNIRLKITNPDGIQDFVRAAEHNTSNVLVSKEGFRNVFDGASIVAMMYLISSNIIVKCESCTSELKRIFEKYAV